MLLKVVFLLKSFFVYRFYHTYSFILRRKPFILTVILNQIFINLFKGKECLVNAQAGVLAAKEMECIHKTGIF